MSSTASTATAAVVRFALDVGYDDLSPLARERATAGIADTVGVALAGAATEVASRLLEAMEDAGALGGPHVLFGVPQRAGALDAAQFNGVAAHALDFDDTNLPGPMHPGCHLVPSLLAISELRPATGQEFLTAYAVGHEIDAKLCLLVNPAHYDAGWHATSTLGTVAAAAAAGRLLGLSAAQMNDCLAIAASSAAGLRGNIGSMTKPLHAGAAARAAVQAALLARRGFTGSAEILDRKHGFLSTFAAGADVTSALRDLGGSWEIETSHGLVLKPYPCCGEATAAIEAALELKELAAGAEISRIVVRTNERSTRILTYPSPTDVEQARFSMQFCVAVALVRGKPDLGSFSESAVHDPAVQALMGRVTHEIDEEHRAEHEYGASIEAELADGRVLHVEVPVSKGWAARWLSAEEQREKFVMCARAVISEAAAEKLHSELAGIESVPDVGALAPALAPS